MKKTIAMLVAVVMTLGMLIACAPVATDPVSTEPTTPETQTGEPTETTEVEDPAVKSNVELVFWSMWEATEPQGIVFQEAADAFYEETGIKVNIEFRGRAGIREGLEPAIQAGTTIDLFDDNYDRSNKTWTKYTIEVEDLMDKYNYEETARTSLISGCRATSGGVLHAIPYQPSIYTFLYNIEIFEAAGVTAIPETWDQFIDVCEKVKAAGYTPCTSDDAYILNYLGHYYGRLAGQDEVIDTVMNGGWSTKPAAMQTLKAYEEMASKGYFSEYIASNVYPAAQNGEFALGEAAMIFCGSFLPNEIKSIAGEDYVWGAFPFPLVDGGVEGFECANLSAQCFNILESSEHPDEAFQFIMYLTKGKWDAELSTRSLGVPADTTNAEWPAQLENFKGAFDQATTRWESAVGTKLNADMQPILKENFIKLCAGIITAEEFAATVDACY